MTDYSAPLPSRRAQREAREAAGNPTGTVFPSTPAAGEVTSRRAMRRQMSGASGAQDPNYDNDDWIVTSASVGQSTVAVKTLHVENFPTGEISGPIDHTGEIILTGPVTIAAAATTSQRAVSINASPDVDAPGIPRRATEALSIIGRAAPMENTKSSRSVGGGVTAGFATFLGLLVATLIWLAYYTNLI